MTEHQLRPAQETDGSPDAPRSEHAIGTGSKERPVTVLALDGGGMRGLYSTTLLQTLADRFARERRVRALDVGRGFDVIVGTSTGGILATALAAGVSMREVQKLYREQGPQIFSNPFPTGGSTLSRVRSGAWLFRSWFSSANCNRSLAAALKRVFGDETIGQLYDRRGIRLCVPTTGLLRHSPRVFKTPHLQYKDRDNQLSLVDICMATSAAPAYLPLVSVGEGSPAGDAYSDGGLWANNPVLVGLIEGIAVSAPEQPVHVLSVGTCSPTSGAGPVSRLDRGIRYWLQGLRLLALTMDAQGQSAHYSARLLAAELRRLGKDVALLRCEESAPSSDQVALLQLDSASKAALALMEKLGTYDGDETYRWRQDSNLPNGRRLAEIFQRMPETNDEAKEASG